MKYLCTPLFLLALSVNAMAAESCEYAWTSRITGSGLRDTATEGVGRL